MPGEQNDMMGDYTIAEIRAMSAADLVAAQERSFKKPLVSSPLAGPIEVARAAAGIPVGSSVPERDAQPADDGNVWARNKTGGEEFTCPSGQKCRLRPLNIEQLMMEGVLDQVTRLEGLAQHLVNLSSGQPPEKQQMPSKEDFGKLLSLINVITPLAVAEPRVYADDDPSAPEDAIHVSDIELMDRVAIMEHALSKLKALDKFRHPR